MQVRFFVFSHSFLPLTTMTKTAATRIVRKEDSTTEQPLGLWLKEVESGLYLVGQPARLDFSCETNFLSIVRSAGFFL